ncbi:hypothetical protein [Runella sp.]|uniref:hypothetical protein n=1 Tax=Runella sp. TaxID=1960881 RepID=UPI003D0C80E8
MKDALFMVEILAGFIVVFSILWSGICFLIAWVSGWRHLASLYQTTPLKEGFYTGIYGRIGLANYNGVLRLGFSEKGMYLHVMPLFKLGHDALLIPWSELKNVQQSNSIFGNYVKCKVDGVTISLPYKHFGTLQSYLSAYT